MFPRLAFLLALSAGVAEGIMLTPDNFDDQTAGKSVFIKFFAPWCGHCKKLAPDWDKLTNEFSADATKLVAEVDCTAAGKPLCDAHGVKGFPTLKFGDPSDLEDYQSGRDYDSLKKHIEEKLVPNCSPINIDLCDDAKKAEIKRFQEMPKEELEKLIEEKQGSITEAEAAFKKGVEGLQASYQKMQEEKEAVIEAVKAAGLGLMKTVSKHAAKAAAKSEL